jgi:subtilase family serine protease
MKKRRSVAILSSGALVAALGTSLLSVPSSSAATAGRVTLAGNHSKAADTSRVVSHVAGNTAETFEVALSPRDPAAVSALATAVSNPRSAQFHHYLNAAQWEARFSPSSSQVARVTGWLRSQGFSVGSVTPDRLSIQASGTAARVEKAFGVRLNTYRVHGAATQLAANDASMPAAFAGLVSGVLGLDQSAAVPSISNGSGVAAAPTAASPGAIAPPAGFRNPSQCSAYYGQRNANHVPAYGGGYPNPLPLNPCGYIPQQFRSAYGLNSELAAGVTGQGETVAIVDAYASSTLPSDAQRYAQLNDPAHPLASSQYSQQVFRPFTNTSLCGASGWLGEQTLDVEAVHATAPGANILYVGGKSCLDPDLLTAVRFIVDNGLAQVVTNSYGDPAGDLLVSASFRASEDTVLQMAATTGITVQFSSGDFGDEFATTGLVSPDYPASSPWVTAVGGTSLAVTKTGSIGFQTGWSTGRSLLCTPNLMNLGGCTKSQLGTYLPPSPGGWQYGAGGGTSYQYSEPYYQVPLVPAPLAGRNSGITGRANRVVPDIAMDADPSTGMLVGETQAFPNGVYYDQYRIGGTSLASPLFAGVVALADQAAGVPLGFLNPVLYKADGSGAPGFYDVVPQGKLAMVRWDFANSLNNAFGFLKSVRTLDYQGAETYCDGSNNCGTRNVVISTAKGYDDITGLGTPEPGFVATLSKF